MRRPRATIDFETRSSADLKKVGGYRYAMNWDTKALCLAYKLPGQPVKLWHPPMSPPSDLFFWVEDGGLVEAHNAEFEWCIWNYVMTKEGWPQLSWKQLTCSAAKAAVMALPRSLEGLCDVLNTEIKKDKDGKKIMMRLAKLKKPTTKEPDSWDEDPLKREKLYSYCIDDVLSEEGASEELPDLMPLEQKMWRHTAMINERGVYCDLVTCAKASELARRFERELLVELKIVTHGAVKTAKQHAKLLAFIRAEGVETEDLKAGTVQHLLKQEGLTYAAKRALEIRSLLNRSSLAKFDTMMRMAGPDRRIRGTFMHHGASTGRDTGKGIQPQNYPRGNSKEVEKLIYAINGLDYEDFKAIFPNVFDTLSNVLRGMLMAAPGKKFVAADFAAVETRVLFWLADHKEGLNIFYNGDDIYKDMASKIYDIPISEVTKDQRQLGKQAILGCVAEGTPILTEKGFINIDKIKDEKVWNGEKWCKHKGLLAKGLKTVIKSETLNIELTHDHWILQENVWRAFGETVLNEDMKPQNSEAQTAGSKLSVQNLNEDPSAVSLCAAYVELKKAFESITFIKEEIYYAESVLIPSADKRAATQIELLTWCLTQGLESVGMFVSTTSKKDATIPMTKTSNGMAVVELKSPSNRLEHFWNTLLRCAGLTNGDSLSTELITVDTMSPETLESFLKKKTTRIVETYDLASVEKGNRYQAANSIVHNCGYGMGVKKFMQTCKGYGINIDEPLAEKTVKKYRTVQWPVPALWKDIERAALGAVERPGKVFAAGKCKFFMSDRFLVCELPSKRRIYYCDPMTRTEDTEWGERKRLGYYAPNSQSKRWQYEETYGGKLVENCVQACAADLMREAALRQEIAGFPIVMRIHDELIAEVDEDKDCLDEFETLMRTLPKWAEGCPIDVEGYTGPRYRKG